MNKSITYFCNTCFTKFTITLDEIDAHLEPEYCPFCGGRDIEEYAEEDEEEFDE